MIVNSEAQLQHEQSQATYCSHWAHLHLHQQGITFRLGNILIILFISNHKNMVCQLSKVKAYFVSVSQALKEIYTV